MKHYKLLFCDLDGTLIETASGKVFPEGIRDMKFKMDVLEKIKEMSPEYVFIVTNQGGIPQYTTKPAFEAKLYYVIMAIREYLPNVTVDAKYCASMDKENPNRKPNAGMLREFAATVSIANEDMLMIGDASGKPGQFSDSDKKTAENLGIDYIDVNDFVREV